VQVTPPETGALSAPEPLIGNNMMPPAMLHPQHGTRALQHGAFGRWLLMQGLLPAREIITDSAMIFSRELFNKKIGWKWQYSWILLCREHINECPCINRAYLQVKPVPAVFPRAHLTQD